MDITPKLFSDSIEYIAVYVARMRADEDFDTIPDMLNRFNKSMCAKNGTSKDQLRQLAVYATDTTYRFAAELDVRDAYTVIYFKKVVAQLMRLLQDNGIELFYILDNELREDRFELIVMLYELSGSVVVTPYDGKMILKFEEVEERVKSHMTHGRNIVYIEKDASINYIEKVMRIATESKYIRAFRNHAPSYRYVKLL